MAIHFQGNPHSTVISCYRPTNMSDELETESFYTKLTSLTRHIQKHKTQLRKDDGYKY